MQSTINLYAEFLLNIRTVTLYATLKKHTGSDWQAHVYSDRKSLRIVHGEDESRIVYPSGISGRATINMPINTGNFINLRLEMTEDGPPHSQDMNVSNDSPWPSSSLGSETTIACRKCANTLLLPGSRIWKDLPRSDWAEMMDFWHCHKPHNKTGSGEQYSATREAYLGRPVLEPGIAFLDTCHILLDCSECSGVKVLNGIVACAECDSTIGVLDHTHDGMKLYKWCVLVRKASTSEWEQNNLQNFICAQLLETIDSQASRRFVIRADDLDESREAIKVFVLLPDLKYSASSVDHGQPRRAMKVLYELDHSVSDTPSEDNTMEEIRVPAPVLTQLSEDLELSNSLIPERARILQGQRVGLLDRFDLL